MPSFVTYGPDINYNSNMRTGYGRGRMPSWAELQIETDSWQRFTDAVTLVLRNA